MKVLCIGRHRYLSDFLADYFRDATLHTTPVVGVAEAEQSAAGTAFDVVLCDYDLVAPLAADRWRHCPHLSTVPVVAVSLTRRAEEAPALALGDAALALYLYLPSVAPGDARRMVAAIRRAVQNSTLHALPAFDRSRETARPSA